MGAAVEWVPWTEDGTWVRKTRTHSWYRPKRFPWDVCKCCGLVALRNDLTRRAMRAGCEEWIRVA